MKKIFGSKKVLLGLIVLAVVILCLKLYNIWYFSRDMMLETRLSPSITLLNDETVLITGGTSGWKVLDSAEIFDPKIHKSHYVGRLNIRRSGHNAILLDDGRVLIVGGMTPGISGINKQAEIYDPKSKKFSLTGKLNIDRSNNFTLTKLNDGNILLIGGGGPAKGPRRTHEIYDPKTGKFSLVAKSILEHMSHSATLMQNGNVLIAGGGFVYKTLEGIQNETEIYNIKANKFIKGPDMHRKREHATAIHLDNDRVLIIGGDWSAVPNADIEIYNPKTNTFEYAGRMLRTRNAIRSVLLKNGLIYLVGGDYTTRDDTFTNKNKPTCELFNPRGNHFKMTNVCMQNLKYGYTPILLKDERLLIIGGGRPNISEELRRKIEIINTKEIR